MNVVFYCGHWWFRRGSVCNSLTFQMASVEEDDLAGMEDVSSEGEDDNYEADLTDGDLNSIGTTAGRRHYRKRARGM